MAHALRGAEIGVASGHGEVGADTRHGLLVSKLNLQIIVLNIVSDKFLIAAIHHSLLD
jgi:hypothetical protein